MLRSFVVLAPLLDHRDDLVRVAEPAQDAAVGRVARLALAPRLEAELLEQDPRHLLRRAEHELLAREARSRCASSSSTRSSAAP